MKRFLGIILTLLLGIAAQAQDNDLFDDGHFTFKGLSLSGSLDDFVANLVSQGYVLKESQSSGLPVFAHIVSAIAVYHHKYS